jgi:hypothetical protein
MNKEQAIALIESYDLNWYELDDIRENGNNYLADAIELLLNIAEIPLEAHDE